MNYELFDDFHPVSSKQWKQKIQFDLKGSDYNQTLLSHTNEGITIKPFYHSDTYKKLDIPECPTDFEICQTIFIKDEKSANSLGLDALKQGADSIRFVADKPFQSELLLKDLSSDQSKPVKIYFQLNFLIEEFVLGLTDLVKNKNIFLNIDLIGNLGKTGNWFYNNQKDHKILRSILSQTDKKISVLGVDTSHYLNSGANTVQQVAYALGHASEYLNFLSGLSANGDLHKSDYEFVVSNMQFRFAMGSNYFFEIAKLRAFRYLWRMVLQKYDLDLDANIFAEPGLRNKTIYDRHVNMLRTTTECMSAVLGGANTIANVAFDAVFHRTNNFGERISRNQLIILKEEGRIRNSDSAKGSYYIEELTFEIADKALNLFKEIEKGGGFVKQLFEGTIQRKIKENAIKEQKQFDESDLVLLGANKYMDPKEKMKNDLELYPFVKRKPRKTEIEPIIAIRLAEKMEQSRLKKESV